MKPLALLLLFTAAMAAFAQSTFDASATEVSSYSTEMTLNAGGKASVTIGKCCYSGLVRVDLTGLDVRMPCTLYVKQYTGYGNWNHSTANPDSMFLTEVSTVPGTWESGTSNAVAEEGAACYSYRSYSATTENAVAWDAATSAPVTGVARGAAGSHINSKEIFWMPPTGTPLSYCVLDSQVLYDLKNGFGGLLIAKSTSESKTQARFWNPSAGKPCKLSWDPNGRPILVERVVLGNTMPLSSFCAPNPFTPATVITYSAKNGSLPVLIFDASGRLVRTLRGENGRAAWNGADASGRPLSAGQYIYRIADGRDQITRSMILAR